jgi:predicted TPR repeat methyltransferase
MSDTLDTKLWKPRSVSETRKVYQDWAATYDDDVIGSGYATPARLAAIAAKYCARDLPLLDFGCGTGLSGAALFAAGFATIDGTDLTPEMLDIAQGKMIYRTLWQGNGDAIAVTRGDYATITATGVVSLGAAPPETLGTLLDCLATGGHLALSFNDPTLADPRYVAALDGVMNDGRAMLVAREHGPHLTGKGMGSDVILLRRL